MATKSRTRRITVFNTTGMPLVYNQAGAFIFPGTSREVDPDDPFAKSLIAKGYLIVQEG